MPPPRPSRTVPVAVAAAPPSAPACGGSRRRANAHEGASSGAKAHEWASSMTVLVTGGAGYIGSHMVHALLEAGERVVVLDNLATGFDWAVAQGALLTVGDAGDQPLVTGLIAKHRIDSIIHFAASVVVLY